jgi:acetylornithine/N-succinyldiaminopimelate aminotransferase
MAGKPQNSFVIPVYPFRVPVSFVRGKGVWLWDTIHSDPYLDALSGRGVSNLGHGHPQIIQALKEQTDRLIHTSNLYFIPQQEELARILCEQFHMQQAFFSNSGAEAIG